MRISRRWFLVLTIFVAVALAMVVLVSSGRKDAILAARTNLLIASQRYPKFTRAQRMSILRELQSERHPLWKDLSLAQLAHRVALFALQSTNSSQPPLAQFMGNATTISTPNGDLVGLLRQANCSLTIDWASYSLTLPTGSYNLLGSTPNYDQVLHNEAGLTTTGGNWPAGCGDAVLGASSETLLPLGTTASGQVSVGRVGYDAMTGDEVVWTALFNPLQSATIPIGSVSPSNAYPVGIDTADLNGDGIGDLVVINTSGVSGGSASVSVLLGNSDGSLQTPVTYALPGDTGVSVVIDDFNGDGIPDIVASTSTFSAGTTTYDISFLAGNGNGTFQAPQSSAVTAPAGFDTMAGSSPYYGLISADLLGNGKKDLVSSAGVVLLGNGNGSFTQSVTLAFATPTSASQWGPNVVAADFNKDGKLDLAVDDGESIQIYTGNGDGTFTLGSGYATIDNIGFLYETDLDGDGNIDLYSGAASGGMFAGDQFDVGESYALMGNGNGTFQGAPELPFVFTGTNLAHLTSSSNLDGVGVNANSSTSQVSMTSYLGNGDGTFTTGPTLQISPVTIQGSSYSFSSLDSFGLGSTRGDGIVDLVYQPSLGFYGPGGVPGYFLATGNGDGSFNAPTFIAAPTFAPSGDFDQFEELSNLFVADVNGDGKADLIYSYYVEIFQTGVYEQGIAIQLSNGDGTFQSPLVIQTYSGTTFPTGQPPAVVYIGDATGSGKVDLFTETFDSSTATTSLQLYLGNGDGTFGSALTPPVADNLSLPIPGAALGQIVIADMNGDGKPDLVTLGTTNDGGEAELAISLGNGDGTFQTPTIVDFGASSSVGFGLAVADFNGDGNLDVAVTGYDPPVDTGIFLGNGNGTVQSFTNASGGAEPGESIYLLVYGPALAANFSGSSLPGLFAGSAVLINQPSSAPTLTPTTTTLSTSTSNIAAGQSVTFTATVTASGSTPSGSVTFLDGSTTLGSGTLNGSGVATYQTSSLGVGGHSITATYQGNSTYAASTSSPAISVTVTAPALIGTTTSLTTSASTVTSGTGVTLNASVAPASGTGTPTGTVIFMEGTTTLAMVSLTNGVASYSTSSLAVGANSITAVYGGDSNYSGSTSNTVTVTVQALTPSFTVGASPTSGSVTAGSSAQTTIMVTPANGFNQQVSFACSGLPTGGSCSFSPQTVTPSGSAVATQLTIATTAQSTALAPQGRGGSRRGWRGSAALAFTVFGVWWLFRRGKNLRWTLMLPVVGLLAFAAVLAGCGSSKSSSSQPQSASYTVTITGTAGTEMQSATYSLTVKQ